MFASFMRRNALVIGAVAVALAAVTIAAVVAFEPWHARDVGAKVEPKQHLADYSWEELSHVADEIGACESEAEAMRLACRYRLCGQDGSIEASETKAVELGDGRQVAVQLAGVWHDERTDGGKAGLTFAFAEAAGEHAMNHAFESDMGEQADSIGGWQACDMRAWLNGALLDEFPADLRFRIVSVQKRTASVVDAGDELDEAGRLAGAPSDWVAQTSDKLWLFSAAELCGHVPERSDLGVDATMTRVYDAEGTQYRLFADAGVAAFAPNDVLVRFGDETAVVDDDASVEADRFQDGEGEKPVATGSNSVVSLPCTWWLRTKMLEFGDGFWLVGTDGAPLNGLGEDACATDSSYVPDAVWGPDHARGVICGFCL